MFDMIIFKKYIFLVLIVYIDMNFVETKTTKIAYLRKDVKEVFVTFT